MDISDYLLSYQTTCFIHIADVYMSYVQFLCMYVCMYVPISTIDLII